MTNHLTRPIAALLHYPSAHRFVATYAAGMPAPGTTKWTLLADDDQPQESEEPESIAPRPIDEPINQSTNQPINPEGQAVWEQALDILRPACTDLTFSHYAAATVTDYQNGNGVHLTLTAPPASADQLRAHLLGPIRREIARVKETGQVVVQLVDLFPFPSHE